MIRSVSSFAVFICSVFVSLAHAKHSATVSYLNIPEYKTRLEQILRKNGYSFSVLSENGPMRQLQITSSADTKQPDAAFLIDLFFHSFINDIQPLSPESQRSTLQFRVAEKLHLEELIELFKDLQNAGAWIEYVKLTPAFNFIINFAEADRARIFSELSKYEYIDQYYSDVKADPKTHFLHDSKRRGTSTIKMTLMTPHMTEMVLESIPAQFLNICVVEKKRGSEFDRIFLTCPNEFSIIQGVIDSVANFSIGQAVMINLEGGDYQQYSIRRDQSYMIETRPFKRLVLEPRQGRADQLAALRQLILDAGYSIFKFNARHGSQERVHQIFIELPEVGISQAAIEVLLHNFRVFMFLDNGLPDIQNEILSAHHKNCADFLTKK